MQLIIESTEQTLTLDGVPVRLWVGIDGAGRSYDLFVHRIGSADSHAQERLARELTLVDAPKEIASCASKPCPTATTPNS